MTDIDAIEKRLNAATPGPWCAADDGLIWHETAMEQQCCGKPRIVLDDDGAGNAVPAYEVCCGEPIVSGGPEPLAQASGDNAVFIAHAPQDIRDLLALVKKQREALKTASGIFDTPIARRRINGEYADDAREMIRAALKESTDE